MLCCNCVGTGWSSLPLWQSRTVMRIGKCDQNFHQHSVGEICIDLYYSFKPDKSLNRFFFPFLFFSLPLVGVVATEWSKQEITKPRNFSMVTSQSLLEHFIDKYIQTDELPAYINIPKREDKEWLHHIVIFHYTNSKETGQRTVEQLPSLCRFRVLLCLFRYLRCLFCFQTQRGTSCYLFPPHTEENFFF